MCFGRFKQSTLNFFAIFHGKFLVCKLSLILGAKVKINFGLPFLNQTFYTIESVCEILFFLLKVHSGFTIGLDYYGIFYFNLFFINNMGQSFNWVSNLNLCRSQLKTRTFAEVHDQNLLHATLLKAVFLLSEQF